MWFHKNARPVNLLVANKMASERGTVPFSSPGIGKLGQSPAILADSADRDLARRVTTFLSTQHRPALRNLEVEVREGTVTLRGRVATFYEKQLSGQLAR